MRYPALDVQRADPEMLLAVVDDFGPSAVEDLTDGGGIRIFFATAEGRCAAVSAAQRAFPDAAIVACDVDDEDWARRSQQSLTPVTVGRITVTPPWFCPPPSDLITIVITPSMGFGTGHHATTRLCLSAMQAIDLRGTRVLDVGTGSGVLAIAAAYLGAAEVVGIDFDSDAVASAVDNLTANRGVSGVRFEVVDVRVAGARCAEVVLANLTGAVLIQNAAVLTTSVVPGGTLIVSGVQAHERDDVERAFSDLSVFWAAEDSGWVGLGFNLPVARAV